ncbi:hypothetical protein GCM10029964_022210 [Kibdelosporangium lantanae]
MARGCGPSWYQAKTWLPLTAIGAISSPTTALTTVDFPVVGRPATATRSGESKRLMWCRSQLEARGLSW